jgi:hypothetical protein
MVDAAQAENEGGDLMRCRNPFASILPACLLAAAFLGIAPVANAGPAGPLFLTPGQGFANNVLKVKDRSRVPRTYVPIAPSYRYYDYPYYFSRGYYPIHIRPGFIYYGHPYAAYRSLYLRRCAHGCIAYKSARRLSHQRSGACRCP